MIPFPRLLAAAAGTVLISLAGCSSDQELYGQLSERQANEMVAVLYGAGIKAEKVAAEGKFSVTTSHDHFSDAVRALNAQGYPRENFDSMGKVFKREGFVSSPLEERARLTHAMSQEIANTLANIDGVITARVHLVMPENNPLAEKQTPSAASVFIKHRADRNLSGQVPQIKALVVNSIEGLKYGNVTVALFPAEGMPGETPVRATPAAAPAAPAAPATPATDNPAPHGPGNLPVIAAGGVAGAVSLVGAVVLAIRRRKGADQGADK